MGNAPPGGVLQKYRGGEESQDDMGEWKEYEKNQSSKQVLLQPRYLKLYIMSSGIFFYLLPSFLSKSKQIAPPTSGSFSSLDTIAPGAEVGCFVLMKIRESES